MATVRFALPRLTFLLVCAFVAAACGGSNKGSRKPGTDGGADGSTSDGGNTDGGGGQVCEPSSKACDGDVAQVCAEDGSFLSELDCAAGCENGECKPIPLDSGWTVHQFAIPDDSVQTAPSYTFEDDGFTAVQGANAVASAYVYDTPMPKSYSVTGRFSVQTNADDDLIGFVFGWQDAAHFYLLDWKKFQQDDGTCGLAEAGVGLHRVESETEPGSCKDFWTSAGTENVTLLVAPSENPDGWVSFTDYDFVLRVKPGHQSFVIKQGDTVVAEGEASDATYTGGKFGFYNYSQEQVRYQFFTFTPAD